MPTVNITIPEGDQCIGRPVMTAVVNQLQEIVKITQDAKVYYPGDTRTMYQAGSTLDDPARDPALATGRYLFITVDEHYYDESIYTTAVNQPEQIPIFHDPLLGVTITPIYATSAVTIEVHYRTSSKTEARRWRDDFRMKISQYRDVNLHTLTYHYPLPKEFIELLKVIYAAREKIEGYGDNLKTWVFGNASTRLTLASNLTDTAEELVIGERQTRVQGYFDFEALPDEPEREEGPGTWAIKFSYRFSYERPLGCCMRYPVMVHNQLLPPEYVTFTNQAYNLDNIPLSYPISLRAMSEFELQNQGNKILSRLPYVPLPLFDDYVLNSENTWPGTRSIFIALCELALPDKRTLLNLEDLGPIVIDPRIVAFLKATETPYLCQIYWSLFNISLYRGEDLYTRTSLTCSSDLTITAGEDLDPRQNWRVRFSIITDPSLLIRREVPCDIVKLLNLGDCSTWNGNGGSTGGTGPGGGPGGGGNGGGGGILDNGGSPNFYTVMIGEIIAFRERQA
jgi:uncharacterized membrane protein YgcG